MANIVINCDDFGMNAATNEAIGNLFNKNLITSCSCLMNFGEISYAKQVAQDFDFIYKN